MLSYPGVILWSCLLLIAALSNGENERFDVLAGSSGGGEGRHEELINIGLIANGHHEMPLRTEAAFPHLTFSCTGMIKKVYFVAKTDSGMNPPLLTLWFQRSGNRLVNTLERRFNTSLSELQLILNDTATGAGLYEQTVNVRFQDGEMLGYTQPHESSLILQYVDQIGETLLNQGSSFRVFPLIGIETDESECTAAFPSRENLEKAVMFSVIREGTLKYRGEQIDEEEEEMYPDMKVTCSKTIRSLIIAVAVDRENVSAVPEIQLLRKRGVPEMYFEAHTLSLDTIQLQSGGLREYKINIELSVMEGDILGISYPTISKLKIPYLSDYGSRVFKRFDDTESLPSLSKSEGDRRWPLITFSEDDMNCVEGFMSPAVLKLLVQREQLEHIETTDTTRHIVPSLSFTRDGQLEKWLFVSNIDTTFVTELPHFQVWRPQNTSFIRVDSTDTKTRGLTPTRSSYINVYQYTLDPPVEVKRGDIIGWQQGNSANTRYLPLILNNTGHSIYRPRLITGDNYIQSIRELSFMADPLIGVQLSGMAGSSMPTTSSTPEQTQTNTPPSDLPTVVEEEDDFGGTLITILGSGVVGLLILLGLALMLLFIMWAFRRHRKKKEKELSKDPQTLNNPLYNDSARTYPRESQEQQDSSQTNGQSVSTLPPPPIYEALKTPKIQKDGSVQYDEPILNSGKAPPPVYSKPNKPTITPLNGPVYHTIGPTTSPHLSPLFSPQLQKSGPLNHQYHTLEPNSSLKGSPNNIRSPPSVGSTHSLDQRASPSTSPFSSLSRSHPSHSREPSSVSVDHQWTQTQNGDPGYELIHQSTPPRWEGNMAMRVISTTLSLHSRASSRATLWDDDPNGPVYHTLTSEGGYSRLHQGGLYVPTKEERQRAATMACRKKINIYAALSEFSDSEEDREVDFFEESEKYWKPAKDSTGLYDQLAQWKYREIMRCHIKILPQELGSGNFGQVSKGEWKCEGGEVDVAVKTLKSGSSEEEVVRFLQEAAIMGQFRHPNIVQLLGVVTLGEPVVMVLELLSEGDLRNHLLSLRPINPGYRDGQGTEGKLLRFCRDIACGMEYLERKMFVHRDLAARNILVADDYTCKIGDFGMARDLDNEHYYISRGGKIPIRWSPPEALNFHKYTTASDVWSFGIVMYEIWSLGHKPYEGYTNPQIQSFVERGERLAPPPGCPRHIYSIMINSWHPEHSCRPTFFSLLKTLSEFNSEKLAHNEEEYERLARTLGAPIEAGRNLYTELQHTYI